MVAEGTWLYDHGGRQPVRMERLDYDFCNAIGEADDEMAACESPA